MYQSFPRWVRFGGHVHYKVLLTPRERRVVFRMFVAVLFFVLICLAHLDGISCKLALYIDMGGGLFLVYNVRHVNFFDVQPFPILVVRDGAIARRGEKTKNGIIFR